MLKIRTNFFLIANIGNIKNIGSYSAISIFNGLFNFLFISYYARVLTLDHMGIIGLLLAITYVTVPAAKFGTTELVGINAVNYSLRRFISFFNDLNTFSIYTVPLVIAIALAAKLYFNQDIWYVIIIVLFSYTRTYIGLSDKILITKRKVKTYTKEKFRTSILTLILGIILLQIHTSWISYFVAIILAELISCFFRYRKGFKFLKFNNDYKEFKVFFIYGLPYMLGLGGAWLLNQFDKILVERYFDTEILGGYTLAYQIGILIRTFNTAIINAIYPDLYESFKKGFYLKVQTKYFLIFLVINLVALILIFLFVDLFFLMIYGVKYEQFTLVVIIISVSFLFEGLYKVWDSLITYLKKNIAKTIILYLSCSIGLLFSFLLLPNFGFLAPSYGVLVAYFSLFVISFLYSFKLSKT